METEDPRADRRALEGPGGHAAVTAALVALAGTSAVAAGAPAAEVWAGAGLAWSIQAASVWRLVAALEDGRSATRPWVAGMAARLGGLGLVAVLEWSTALEGAATALAYVATVVPLLWLEGFWLNRAAASASGDGGGRPDDDRTGAPDGAPGASDGRTNRR